MPGARMSEDLILKSRGAVRLPWQNFFRETHPGRRAVRSVRSPTKSRRSSAHFILQNKLAGIFLFHPRILKLTFNIDVFPVFLHFKTGDFNAGIKGTRSVSHIKIPAMPGAHHFGAVDASLGKRAALMRADILDRVNFSTHLKKRDFLTAGFDEFSGVSGDF